ncbi:MAG: lipoyl(octanoyl) transferase LipB [Betaproteobacteria bacterium]|nr:lipoyl(octanoyl) transferase LipB [Betaproteobacteria bacterium]
MLAPITKYLGLSAYENAYTAMREANRARTSETRDELWLLEHPPVFTLGLAGKPEHLLAPGDIPVFQIDRGGQVTYHGPGQAVVYLLLDIRKLGYGVKELVRRIEGAVIALLADYGIEGFRIAGMPGVYVNSTTPSLRSRLDGADPKASLPSWETREHLLRSRGGREGDALNRTTLNEFSNTPPAKIAAIGLRVANHATYHGVSLNVDMDLEPFSRINPCGYEGLAVTQLKDFGVSDNCTQAGEKLVAHLITSIYESTPNG